MKQQYRHRGGNRTSAIAAWAFASLLLILPAPVFGRLAPVWYSWSYDTYHGHNRPETTGRSLAIDMGSGKGTAAWFGLRQLATPTAVTSPTATVVSPPPTDTAVPQVPPARPTNTAPPAVPSDTGSPQATAPAIPTRTISLEPSLPAVATDTLTVPSMSDQGPAEAASPAPASTPLTPPAMPLQEVTTTTAGLEPEAEAPTTYTARVPLPTGSLLDRLTYNKPGIWGNKAFYVGLAVVYVVLLMLFFRLLFQLGRQSD